MDKIKLLDCTLRDGGYINNWDFSQKQITSTIQHLTNAGIEYIEFGYLTSILGNVNGSQFATVESASKVLPKDRKNSKYMLMADVAQFDTSTLCQRSENTIDGIRVVFYKRQIEQALDFCEEIVKKGYDMCIQPMVTVDYSQQEFEDLIQRFCERYHPYAVAVVDSFGCMTTEELHAFIKILDENIAKDVRIGFHGHDNMCLSQIHALSLFDLKLAENRELIIDASVGGIGRGAGNLCTELIVNHINAMHGGKYILSEIMAVANEVTEPISRTAEWGYSPYFLLTALRRAHPNFASILLAQHDVGVTDFDAFLSLIPSEMLTKCTRPYVEELYEQFLKEKEMA